MSVRSAIGLRSSGVLKMITGNLILLANENDTREGSKFNLIFNFILESLMFTKQSSQLPGAAVVIREAESPLPEDEAHEDADAEPHHRHGKAQARHAAHRVGGAQ